MKFAWQCQKRFMTGELPDPDEYEKIPYEQELEERLQTGRDYLKDLITKLGLGPRAG